MKRKLDLTGVFAGVLLALAGVHGVISETVTVYGEDTYSGTCGADVTWTLDGSRGELVISGTGAMESGAESYDEMPFYAYKEEIKSIVIEDGVTSIADRIFNYCYNVTAVTIPDSVTSIGANAFMGCTALEEIFVPASVTDIGEYALGYYTSVFGNDDIGMTNLEIVGYEGSAAEQYAEDNWLWFCDTTIEDGEEEENTEEDTEEDAAVFSDVCGDDVTWSFDEESGVLTIEGTGDMYDYDMFWFIAPYRNYASRITSVIVKQGVTSIGDGAFIGCSNLSQISIPDSVTGIGYAAFWGCTSLETVGLSENVNYVETRAFYGCSSLREINVDQNNASYVSEDGILYDKDRTTLLVIPRNNPTEILKLPEIVTIVDDEAGYSNKHLRIIYFPENLASVGYGAFTGVDTLEYLMFEGDAPQIYDTGLDVGDVSIYAFLSRTGWTELQEELDYLEEVSWMDLDTFPDDDELSISTEQDTLGMGEMLQLEAVLSPLLGMEFEWNSSDTDIACVTQDGILLGVQPGEVTITVKSVYSAYEASRTFIVTGETYEMPEYQLQILDDELNNFINEYNSSEQILCEALNGIYFLNGNKLAFYSLISGQSQVLYTFDSCVDSYVRDNKLYILESEICYVYDLLTQSVQQLLELDEYRGNAVGVDADGRIYIAATDSSNSFVHRLYLYSPSGELLSEISTYVGIGSFGGFDSTNGDFYVEGTKTSLYWEDEYEKNF